MLNNTLVSVTHGTQRNIIFSFIVFIALFLFALSPNVHAEANKIVIVIAHFYFILENSSGMRCILCADMLERQHTHLFHMYWFGIYVVIV